MLGRAKNMPIEKGDFHESGTRSLRIKEATDRRNSFTDIVAKVVRETRRLSHHILDPLMLTEKASRRASVASIGDFIHTLIADQTGASAQLFLGKEKILKIIDSYTKSSETPLLDIEIDAEIIKQCKEITKYSARKYLTDNHNKQLDEKTDLYIDTIFFVLKGIFTHLLEEKISPKCMSLMVSAYFKYLGEISQLVLPNLKKQDNHIESNIQEKIFNAYNSEFKELIDKHFDKAKSSSSFWAKVGLTGSILSLSLTGYLLVNINENIKCMDIWEDNSDPCNPCIPTRESLLERQQKLIWTMAPTVLAVTIGLFGVRNLRKSHEQEKATARLNSALNIFEEELCAVPRLIKPAEKENPLAKKEKIHAEQPPLPRLSEKLEPEEIVITPTKLEETQDISPMLQLSDIEQCSQRY